MVDMTVVTAGDVLVYKDLQTSLVDVRTAKPLLMSKGPLTQEMPLEATQAAMGQGITAGKEAADMSRTMTSGLDAPYNASQDIKPYLKKLLTVFHEQ